MSIDRHVVYSFYCDQILVHPPSFLFIRQKTAYTFYEKYVKLSMDTVWYLSICGWLNCNLSLYATCTVHASSYMSYMPSSCKGFLNFFDRLVGGNSPQAFSPYVI